MSLKESLVKRFQKCFESIFHNTTPHFIEKFMMEKCGYGSRLIIWKIGLVLFFQLGVTTLPGMKYLIDTIKNVNSHDFALVVPEALINVQQCFSFLNFLVFFSVITKYQKTFDAEWNKHQDLEEWNQIRDKTAKFCNRVSFFYHINMHTTGLVYFFIPTMTYLVEFYYENANVERKTAILVE